MILTNEVIYLSLINWSDSYSVKVGSMDDEHKKLIDLMNKLHDAMSSGKSGDVMKDIIQGLVDYTKKHFSDEEKLMQDNNYPGLIEQQNMHKMFVTKIGIYKSDLDAGKVLSMEVMTFMKDWLINHIQGVDQKYGEFFNNLGIK